MEGGVRIPPSPWSPPDVPPLPPGRDTPPLPGAALVYVKNFPFLKRAMPDGVGRCLPPLPPPRWLFEGGAGVVGPTEKWGVFASVPPPKKKGSADPNRHHLGGGGTWTVTPTLRLQESSPAPGCPRPRGGTHWVGGGGGGR